MKLPDISIAGLALSFVPVALVLVVYARWKLDTKQALYALARMLVQLIAVGYLLLVLFDVEGPYTILIVLTTMLAAAAWISLHTVRQKRTSLLRWSLLSIAIGGVPVLALVTQLVLDLEPWHEPRFLIPIGGMIFANAMNSVSLCAERMSGELERGVEHRDAGTIAFRASMIPVTNSLLAVGLVSLPGMMTGQILSGISPLVAVRYQIVVMCMIFGAAGLSSPSFVYFTRRFPAEVGVIEGRRGS